MNKNISKLLLCSSLIIGFSTATLSSCGDNLNTSDTIQIFGQDSLEAGAEITLTLTNFSGKRIWKSSDTNIATISQNGVVTGISAGEVTITCTLENQTVLTKKISVSEQVNYKKLRIEGDFKTEYFLNEKVNFSNMEVYQDVYVDGKLDEDQSKIVFNYNLSIPNNTLLDSSKYLGTNSILVTSDETNVLPASFEITVLDPQEEINGYFLDLIETTNYTINLIGYNNETNELEKAPYALFTENAYYNEVLESGYVENETGVFGIRKNSQNQFVADSGYVKSQRKILKNLYKNVAYSFQNDFKLSFLSGFTKINESTYRFAGNSQFTQFFASKILSLGSIKANYTSITPLEDGTLQFEFSFVIADDKGVYHYEKILGEITSIGSTNLDVGSLVPLKKDLDNPNELNASNYKTLKSIREKLQARNYITDLGQITAPINGVSTQINIGKVYNTPNYIYYDFDKKFLEFANNTSTEKINDYGYINLAANKVNQGSKAGIYEFAYLGNSLLDANINNEDFKFVSNEPKESFDEVAFNIASIDLFNEENKEDVVDKENYDNVSDELLVEMTKSTINLGGAPLPFFIIQDDIIARDLYENYGIADSDYNESKGFYPIGAGIAYYEENDKFIGIEIHYLAYNQQNGIAPIGIESNSNFGEVNISYLETLLK